MSTLLAALAGCLGGGGKVPPATSTTYDARLGDPLTVGGILNRTPHIEVAGPTSIKWELLNVTAPTAVASLVHFPATAPFSRKADAGSPLLIAIIPVNITAPSAACTALPEDVRYFWRAEHSGGNGNLTGRYGPGWYHVVVAGKQNGWVTLTFNASSEQKPFRAPVDPYVNGSGGLNGEGWTPTLQASVPGGSWYAFAHHLIPGGTNVDGGREQSLSIGGDCSRVSRTEASNSGAVAFTQAKSLWTAAAGTSSSFEVKGGYVPAANAKTPENTQLEAAWVWIQEVTVPTTAG